MRRPDRSRPRHGLRQGRDVRRCPGRPPARGEHHRSRPAGSRASPRARARVSASASSSTARGASPSSHVLTAAEADRVAAEAVRIARASATALRDRTRLDDRPPAHGTFETPVEEDPFTVPLETQDRRPARRRPRRQPGQGHRLHRVDVCRAARVEDVRRDRRQPDRADHHPRRRRGRGQRRRRRRAPAPELPGLGRRLGRRRLRDRPPACASPSAPSRWPRRRSRC